MTKLVCLYWVPGSVGDTVRQMLISTGNYANHLTGTTNVDGRTMPTVDPYLFEQFPTLTNIGWHNKIWSVDDLDRLQKIANTSAKPYIIGTHQLDQFKLIKSTVDQCVGIGITYNTNLYPAVIKNWCKKAASDSPEAREIYNKSHPVLSKKLREKGLFPKFMLTELLKYVNNIPKQVLPEFDVNVNLGDVLNADLSALTDFLTPASIKFFDYWYTLQDPLYKLKFEHNADYVNALGYNYCATTPCNEEIILSNLDQLLISHYCKTNNWQQPQEKLKTHTQAASFFNHLRAS